MKNPVFLNVLIIILLAGCQVKELHVPAADATLPTVIALPSDASILPRKVTATLQPTHPAVEAISTETMTLSATATLVQSSLPVTIPPESRMTLQCIEVAPVLPDGIESSGIIVLGRGIGDKQRQYETILVNMATDQTKEISVSGENQGEHTVSSDGKFIAYRRSSFGVNGASLKSEELVVASAEGLIQKEFPWEKKWVTLLGWTNDHRLLLSYDEAVIASSDEHKIPRSYLVLDPFSGEQKVEYPDFPGFLDNSNLPYWNGWYGIVYDPTLTRAIYPRLIDNANQQYTFTIWDLYKKQVIASLEDQYENFTSFSMTSPMPHWSPDGSQFVFRGQVLVSDQLVSFELYRVSRDGQVDQLTHLSPIELVDGSNLSWSPDERYIAMYLDPWNTSDKRHVALLNIETLDVTDYCLPIRGEQIHAPIWSPEGRQFLIVDQSLEGHPLVILVDIEKGIAAKIAEDMIPLGWMK